MMKYCAIDVETTGLDPDAHQVIELAVVVETDWLTPVAELPTLHLLVEHDEIRGTPFALALNARVLAELAKPRAERCTPTRPARLVADDVQAWLTRNLGPARWTLAGKNVGTFDLRFLERLDGWRPNNFRRRVIDPGAFWLDPAADRCVPDTAQCLARAGVAPGRPHHPVDDCRQVIELVRRFYARGETRG
jgi:oligoribonuclease